MNARLLFVHILSSLHAGTGQGAGIIDLPIAREKVTGIPFLPGSSLKGALSTRCYNREGNGRVCEAIFGPKVPKNAGNTPASLAQFSDQKLLLLPVRSLAGICAWVTSPYALYRLQRDMLDAGIEPPGPEIPAPSSFDRGYVVDVNTAAIILRLKHSDARKVYLEELDLAVESSAHAAAWACWLRDHLFPRDEPQSALGRDEKGRQGQEWQDIFTPRFCIVHDDLFSFLLESATEVSARIRVQEDTKTVNDGALWYEETLPSETILAGLVLLTSGQQREFSVQRVFDEIADLSEQTLQLGGKATSGHGFCHIKLVGGQ